MSVQVYAGVLREVDLEGVSRNLDGVRQWALGALQSASGLDMIFDSGHRRFVHRATSGMGYLDVQKGIWVCFLAYRKGADVEGMVFEVQDRESASSDIEDIYDSLYLYGVDWESLRGGCGRMRLDYEDDITSLVSFCREDGGSATLSLMGELCALWFMRNTLTGYFSDEIGSWGGSVREAWQLDFLEGVVSMMPRFSLVRGKGTCYTVVGPFDCTELFESLVEVVRDYLRKMEGMVYTWASIYAKDVPWGKRHDVLWPALYMGFVLGFTKTLVMEVMDTTIFQGVFMVEDANSSDLVSRLLQVDVASAALCVERVMYDDLGFASWSSAIPDSLESMLRGTTRADGGDGIYYVKIPKIVS